MTMLAEHVDGIIGVGTHCDTFTAAAVGPIGSPLESTDAPAHTHGYRHLLECARQHVPVRLRRALEGSGSYGTGPSAFLDDADKQAAEGCRPKRPSARDVRAMHMITLIRMRLGPVTKTHIARSVGEGKSPHAAQRCLKRTSCRLTFKILEYRNRQTRKSYLK
ncbi:hypothetical protein [Streptomyces acidicola]|uniref:hypothetical protein n=1 Tax=Streptomyces acidicola TaxID=2596892 RepID=UPI0037FDF8D1